MWAPGSFASRALMLLHGADFAVPSGFLLVDRQRYELKAITPDESKFWVRDFPTAQPATLDFWAQALRKHFVEQRGYRLLSESNIQHTDGTAGREFFFETFTRGKAQHYMLTLFVGNRSMWTATQNVRVTEFVATPKEFPSYLEAVRTAVMSD